MLKPAFTPQARHIISLVLALTALLLSSCQITPVDPIDACTAVAQQPIKGVIISSSTAVTEHDVLPPYCAITGTIEPEIAFEARFPLDDWNGKYYQSGCGGYCGRVLPDKPGYSNTINQALLMGFATITTDSGHQAGLGDASWAKNNPVAVEVYAHKGIPLTHEVGNQLVENFYGSEAHRSYFGGCSNGGRMAAMAAQRYPTLFDGILGGSAVLNLSRNGGIYGSWVVQANTTPNGERILNRANFASKLPALERAVLQQCDETDGQIDGMITLPRRCAVDVKALPSCSDEHSDNCFTETEREVLRKWYQGPRDSSGKSLYPGMPAGSERYWLVWFLDGTDRVAPGNALGGDYARFLGFEEGAPDDYTALDFDFDRDPARLEANGKLLDSMDTNLSAFQAAGGKFLMWHGWQDPLVLPDQSVAYYEGLQAEMAETTEVDEFFRLFMIPGQGHCWEIPSAAPDRFDPITMLDEWVETNEAPDHLIADALDPDTSDFPATMICPYPALPHYLHEGDAAQHCATSRPD